MKRTMHKVVRYLMAGLGAGISAGALAGLAEGLSIWLGDPAAGALAPLYGGLFYLVLLGLAGAPAGLVAWALARWRKSEGWTPRWAWTLSLVALLAPVALVVARFRIIRDIFHEKLALGSGAGIGVHVGLLVGAAALAAGLWWLTSPTGRGPLRKAGAGALTAGVVALVLLIGLPLSFTGGRVEPSVPETSAKGGPVILVMVDTLRADRLPLYGYNKIKTPAMDSLGKDATVFENNFSNASWTRPSTASILTGLTPSAHKTMYKADRLPEGVHSVAEAFKGAGYTTGGIVTNYNIAPYFNFGQGFDDYRYLEPDYYFWADEGASKLSLYNVVRVLREKVAPAGGNPEFYYRDAATTTDAAISWMEKRKDKPFFLFLTYMDPHDPYFARPLTGESYSRAANTNPDPAMAARFSELYDGEIAYWDQHFGRMLEWLKKEGLYEKATLVVTSDHGEEFQEHGGWWHGTTLYEEQIQVPLVFKRAGQAGAGERREDLSSAIDLAPTLLGLAGGEKHESWKGRDLFGGGEAPATVFAEEDHQGNVLRALRGRTWKLIEANAGNPRGLAPVELYQMETDAKESKNLAADKPEVVKEQQAALEKASQGEHAVDIQRDQMEVDEESQRLLEKLGYTGD